MRAALLLLALLAGDLVGQPIPGQAVLRGSPPGGIGGACTQTSIGYLTNAGQYVSCVSKVWTVGAGGSSGVGWTACTQNPYTTSGTKTCTHNLNLSTPYVVSLMCLDGGAAVGVNGPLSFAANGITFSFAISPSSATCFVLSGGGAAGAAGATGATGAAGANGTTTNGGIDCKDVTGSTTVYTCPSPSPVPGSYATGALVTFVPQTTNTTTGPTLNVAALGAKNLKATASTLLAIGALVGGNPYLFEYDGTQFVQAGGAAAGFVSSSQYVYATLTTGTSYNNNQPLLFVTNSGSSTAAMHSTSVNPGRFIATTTGLYFINAKVLFGGGGNKYGIEIWKNGSLLEFGTQNGTSLPNYAGILQNFSLTLYLTAADYLEVHESINFDSTSTDNPQNGTAVYFAKVTAQ